MNGVHTAFTGRVGGEPERRYTRDGKAMLVFSVAVDENPAATEERTASPTQWIRCTAWENRAEELADSLTKGSAVYVEGKLRLNTWTAQDGTERHGLAVSAWTVQPLGVIGRKAPRRERAPEAVRRAVGG